MLEDSGGLQSGNLSPRMTAPGFPLASKANRFPVQNLFLSTRDWTILACPRPDPAWSFPLPSGTAVMSEISTLV